MNVVHPIPIHLGARIYDLAGSDPLLVILLLGDEVLHVAQIGKVVDFEGVLGVQLLCLCEGYSVLEHFLEVRLSSHSPCASPDGDGEGLAGASWPPGILITVRPVGPLVACINHGDAVFFLPA